MGASASAILGATSLSGTIVAYSYFEGPFLLSGKPAVAIDFRRFLGNRLRC